MRVEIYIIMYSKENPQLPQVKYQGKKILQVSPEHISPVRTWGRQKWHKIVTIQKYQIHYTGASNKIWPLESWHFKQKIIVKFKS